MYFAQKLLYTYILAYEKFQKKDTVNLMALRLVFFVVSLVAVKKPKHIYETNIKYTI